MVLIWTDLPGAALEIDRGNCRVHWPAGRAEALRPFTDKAAYLRDYANRMRPLIEASKRRWPAPRHGCARRAEELA